MTAAHVVCVLLDGLRIQSEANLRDHWRTKSARAKTHRSGAFMALKGHPAVGNLPATITLTRIAVRKLDDDNLQSGFKATRDGVADWLGIDDGDSRLTWRYAQRAGKPKQYAAEIRVEWQA